MSYHPLMGILIFVFALIISFYFGKTLFKKSSKNSLSLVQKPSSKTEKGSLPKGEITSPDAPWLKEK